MPSLQDMRQKAKEAGLMKLDRLIAKRQHIPTETFPIPVRELCERFEKLYTGCVNDVMRELTLLNRRDVLSIRTGSARFEIVTFAPVQRDAYAILGIVSLWAAAASVLQIEETPSGVTVSLAGPGEFAAAFMDRPKEVRCNGKPLSFVWVEESGLLLARLPDIPSPTVSIRF